MNLSMKSVFSEVPCQIHWQKKKKLVHWKSNTDADTISPGANCNLELGYAGSYVRCWSVKLKSDLFCGLQRETCESAKKTWGIKTHPSSGPWTYQENPFINQLICVSTYLPPQMGLLDTQKTLSYRFLERVYMRLWCCTDFVKKFYMKLWCLIRIVWETGNLIPKR